MKALMDLGSVRQKCCYIHAILWFHFVLIRPTNSLMTTASHPQIDTGAIVTWIFYTKPLAT